MPENRRRRRRGSPAYQRAKRDVMLSYRPYRRELRQARREGRRDYRQANARVGDVYGALDRELAPLSGQYAGQMEGITQGLQGNLAGLTDLLGGVEGVPQSEVTAGAGLFGTIGAGGLSELASQQARNVGYNTSAQRQGSMERAVTQRNYRQDLTTFLDDLRRQRVDAARDLPGLIRQRMDEINDRNFERSMALREFTLRARQVGLDTQSQAALSSLLGQMSPREIVAAFGNG